VRGNPSQWNKTCRCRCPGDPRFEIMPISIRGYDACACACIYVWMCNAFLALIWNVYPWQIVGNTCAWEPLPRDMLSAVAYYISWHWMGFARRRRCWMGTRSYWLLLLFLSIHIILLFEQYFHCTQRFCICLSRLAK